MPTIPQELISALRRRLTLVADEMSRRQPEQHMQKLEAVSLEIDRLSSDLPDPVHPQLAHYFQRASYTKALEFLEQAEQS